MVLFLTSHKSSATREIRPATQKTRVSQPQRHSTKLKARTEVVRDDDDTPREIFDRSCERIN
jgi:hypothetical protein